jgi:hypothetical protein
MMTGEIVFFTGVVVLGVILFGTIISFWKDNPNRIIRWIDIHINHRHLGEDVGK